MPYVWTDPEVFLSYQGVEIYAIYAEDDHANPAREFWYGFYETCSDDDDEGASDIREVTGLLDPATLTACQDDHKAILKALIDAEFLQSHGFIVDGYLCDNANSIRDAVKTVAARRKTAASG